MIEQAFRELYPNRQFNYNVRFSYSGKFDDYNANIKLHGHDLMVNMSRSWEGVSREIQIGCIQTLLAKLFKGNVEKTTSMDLYNMFLQNVHKSVEKYAADPILLESFERVNEEYFNGFLDRPNLEWCGPTTTKLGAYEYGRDLITISSILRDESLEYLDYVMYHELLHKKHGFSSTATRSLHHSKSFRNDEAKFKGFKRIEKELQQILRKKKFWKAVKNFW